MTLRRAAVALARMVGAAGHLAVALLVLTSLAAGQQPRTRPSAPPPRATEPRPEAAVPFRVGETLTFDVAWSTYLIAGSATSAVVEKKPSYNSNAYYIVAEGRPLPLLARLYPLYYKMDTLFDALTTLSQRSALYTEEGSSHKLATTRFDRPGRRALFEIQGDTTARDQFPIPVDVQDGLATLYWLRTRAFRAGDRISVPVADNGTLYNVTFDVAGPEHMRMRVGEFDAWNLKITIVDPERKQVGRNIAVWMSNDARRLPLKIQADLPVGYFVLALRDAR